MDRKNKVMLIAAIGAVIVLIASSAVRCGATRQADIVLVTGPVTIKMRDYVLRVWNEIPEPKVTVAVGICPISGGVFRDSYAIAGPLSRLVPVDVNVPGCPPRPQAIMEGVVLAKQIWMKKLGILEG